MRVDYVVSIYNDVLFSFKDGLSIINDWII